ncbi:MAG: diaminopimelate epimerase [Candidatus Velamenicoccus archaeovorus]
MRSIPFVKLQGSGNDFVLLEPNSRSRIPMSKPFIEKICDRRFGVGADGVLLMEASQKADVRMRIFNADGSEAEMCGNGARCLALYFFHASGRKAFSIETGAGLLAAGITEDGIKIRMTDPKDIRLDLCVKAAGKEYDVDFVDTGVPHAVIEVPDVAKVPVARLGRLLRFHDIFSPAGTNVDFIQRQADGSVNIRTYERGVEDETLACGTGSVAAAVISVINHEGCGTKPHMKHRVCVKTKSGEVLRVYFTMSKKKIFDVWLEGQARVVFRGKYLSE